MIHWLRATFAAVFLLSASAAHAGNAEGAKSYIDGVAKQVLEILKTGKSQKEKQAELVTLFAGTVDIPFVGKFVLGRHWNAATPEQQKAYLDAYGPFILNNYASKLTRYSGQSYKLKEARPQGGNYIVTMEILDGNNPPVLVDYRLGDSGKSYKLADIVVEGVSLLATQRSEFNSIVSGKGLDYLVVALQKKNASYAAAK